MSIALYRIDDRLIHGQVVVGWGQPLGLGFVALVDEAVHASEWEQELYRMGVPPSVEVRFAGVEEAVAAVADWEADLRSKCREAASLAMAALCAGAPSIRRVNVGGIHFRPGRTERLRFVYLSDEEAAALRALGASGVEITAQDVPTAAPAALESFA